METLKLTTEQAQAVNASGNALLVSAAAGSGKTFVLVQRLLRQITSEEIHADITDFLIITYTKAAAAELKSKILREINRRIASEPGNRHLRRQTVLCLKANISTIHSFCTELLRENAHVIGLPPEFRVADEAEAAILRGQVLERLIEEKYENIEKDINFSAIARLMSEARGDGKLTDAVLDAYSKLQSHVSPEKWVEEQKQNLNFDCVTDVGDTTWGREILDGIYVSCEYWYKRMRTALEDMAVHPDMMKAYGDSFSATVEGLKNLKEALAKGWDVAYSCREIPFPRPKNVKGYEEFKAVRKKCREAMEKAVSRLDGTSAELLSDLEDTKPETLGFLELLMDFDAAYKKAKRQRGIIDFSDQEHLTAQLLFDFEKGAPTPAAENIALRYREVLVDEYQDVNEVQELIFGAVSKEGKNIFMVGDVKQSIYRFRMADPRIFLKKYNTYADYTDDINTPSKVILPMNFRSDREILEAVNYTFKNLMSKQFGEMDYTDREALNYGAGNPETEDEKVEYCILDLSQDESGTDTYEAEAEFVAGRIREIIEGGTMIPDGSGGLRRAEYGDVAILLRSVKNRAWQYALQLDRLGIPVELPSDVDFFRCYEVSLAISFLAVIDNPRQDIPLIAVLRSPVYGFTEDELVEIHVCDRDGGMYNALLKRREEDSKCDRFLQELDYFRRAAGSITVEKLLWLIYNRTGFWGIMAALDGGSEKEENLIILSDYARRFEANGYKGLFRFVAHIRTMIEQGENITREDISSGRGVRIMSIHKSKGLEFPIVFLADTAHKFNTSDTLKPALFHRELGIGLYRRDRKRRIKYPTVARTAVSRRIISEMMAEELRVLYVAMTRAKNRLIMVTSYKDAVKQIEKRALDAEYPAQPAILSGTASYGDWMLLTAMTRPEFSGVCETGNAFNPNTGTPWKIRLIKFEHVSGETVKTAECDTTPEKNAYIIENIKEKISYSYPFESSHLIPSKVTATELKGKALDPEVSEDAVPMTPSHMGKVKRPSFIQGDRPLTGTERGTAIHTAMQYIDYYRCGTVQEIMKELTRLRDKNYLSARQAEAVDPEKILGFFRSELGQRVLGCKNVRREFKFSLMVPADTLFSTEAEDEVLLQGVVDCYMEEDGEISIIDFKSDYITEKNLEEKTAGYVNQVRLYARALEKITGKKVRNTYLYFFHGGLTVEV